MNPTTSADALAQLEQNQASAQDPNAILTAQKQSLGVDQAQATATGLQGAIASTNKLLAQVAPSVMGRTQGSLVTSAQANKQISNEQAPITTDLTNESNQYNNAETNANKLESEAEQNANGIYQGQQDKQSYLQNVYNNLYKQEQDASAKQASDAAAAEAQREFNVSASQKTSTAAPSKTDVMSSLNTDIAQNVANYKNEPAFWTEKTLIPQLVAAYPELTPAQITQQVYALRKQYE